MCGNILFSWNGINSTQLGFKSIENVDCCQSIKPKGREDFMKRIQIICTENDMESILTSWEDNCPFSPFTTMCGENSSCGDCIKENVEFNICEEESSENNVL